MAELKCVICSEELLHVNVEGQLIPTCTKHGAWIQEPQLVAITIDKKDEASPEAEVEAIGYSVSDKAELAEGPFHTCPVCANTLRKDIWKYGSGIVIDVCDEHGIWVDAGELSHIESWQEALETYDV